MNIRVLRSARRVVVAAAATMTLAATAACGGGSSDGKVHVAAVLPLSGLYGANGKGELAGAQLAIDEFNKAGGVKSMDGAKIVLDKHDAGETVESSVSAANKALGGNEKPAASIGAWLSSFSLGVTEVAERQQVPCFTVGFADELTHRGFKYTYKVTPYSTVMAQGMMDNLKRVGEGRGKPVKTIALVGDNTAAMSALFKAVRGGIAKKAGYRIVADEVWTPPLGNASSVAKTLKDKKPDAVVFGATNYTDASAVLSAAQEYDVDTTFMANGQWMVMPEYLKNVGAEKLEGLYVVLGTNPIKGMEKVADRYVKRTKQPFMTPDAIGGYLEASIIAAAVEKAGSAEPQQVNEALKKLKLTEGAAVSAYPAKSISFDERGMIRQADPLLVQWQDGDPVTVFPKNVATGAPKF